MGKAARDVTLPANPAAEHWKPSALPASPHCSCGRIIISAWPAQLALPAPSATLRRGSVIPARVPALSAQLLLHGAPHAL